MYESKFQVKAREHSVSGGVGLDTGILLRPGQVVHICANPNDRWSAGVTDRVSNANGLGNPLGGNFGLYTRGLQSFLYGSLVGSLDGGKSFFGIGTNLTMTILTKGTLTLHYWDSNRGDNSGTVRVLVNVYTGPTNVNPI